MFPGPRCAAQPFVGTEPRVCACGILACDCGWAVVAWGVCLWDFGLGSCMWHFGLRVCWFARFVWSFIVGVLPRVCACGILAWGCACRISVWVVLVCSLHVWHRVCVSDLRLGLACGSLAWSLCLCDFGLRLCRRNFGLGVVGLHVACGQMVCLSELCPGVCL